MPSSVTAPLASLILFWLPQQVDKLGLLAQHINKHNYTRTCLYLLACARWVTWELEVMAIHQVLAEIPCCFMDSVCCLCTLFCLCHADLLSISFPLSSLVASFCAPSTCCSYLPTPEDKTVLDVAHEIYVKVGNLFDALRVALRLDDPKVS